jgi:hypothetical protein
VAGPGPGSGTSQHNDLLGIQGGDVGNYYHLLSAEYLGSGPGTMIRNPMTTVGDVMVAGSGGTPTRVPVAVTNGWVLTVVAGAPAWAAPTGGGGGGLSYATTIGTGALTTIDVTHSLGTTDIDVALFELTGLLRKADAGTEIRILNTNQIRLVFAVAPALNSLRVVVNASGGAPVAVQTVGSQLYMYNNYGGF